jgi:CsoR family transcriptional regulator, copper-sensing transcriptional repressor
MKKGKSHGDNHHTGERKAHHSDEKKENMVSRLHRIEGQIRGIARMIDEDVYCDDILHQISSVESALHGVKTVLLEAHMNSCVIEQIREGKDEVMEELLVTLRKFLK